MSEYPYGTSDPERSEEPQTEVRPEPYTPPVPGANTTPEPPEFDYGQHAAHAHHEDHDQHNKRAYSGLKAVLAGLLGGVIGAAALTGALYAGGVIGKTTVVAGGSSGQQVTIDPNDEDTTVANAVAAKALPSVVTVYSTYADGEGMGSGVIYDKNGNIITNNHVIEDAESISVTMNGQSYAATLVGTDASSDLAVIHADFGDAEVTPMEIGNSSDLQVGDWVMSVGSPFGLENSVSQGIVSALSRNTLMEGASGNTLYTNLIQTDATINPGNSGGALVNAEGQLVGICTLYSSDTQSFAGIGYAIPSDYAVEVADKIIAGETVTHAYIGLTMQTVNAQNAFRNNLAVDQGAYVVEVAEGGPAAAAGIQVGDVITAIGDEQITSADGAILAVRSHSEGETVPVTVMRGSEQMTFDVTLGSDETLQQQQQEQQNQTVNVNGQDVSLEDLIDLYQQYQEQQYSPFGGR
ncbi:S1C family serine protease [Thermophilibacter provencensis]|uniref:Trypsin-like peptidase domain-containing protein n=1 Tax=Thermophilibacter provencensis TaxID=1852386 RepID=A0ABT7V3S5_9ACTN|nr:trypsin-like peptidase domain-containing protein [Thermophilibacter provencensis]MDM8271257.1 trypsin-like peptidase domain-containing protein [Thermophilibacter provencensis]